MIFVQQSIASGLHNLTQYDILYHEVPHRTLSCTDPVVTHIGMHAYLISSRRDASSNIYLSTQFRQAACELQYCLVGCQEL